MIELNKYQSFHHGKRIENGKWIMGDVYFRPDGKVDITTCGEPWWLVYPETVGRCSGHFAAKSYRGEREEDRLIFQDDIISFGGKRYIVTYSHSFELLEMAGNSSNTIKPLVLDGNDGIEIVGSKWGEIEVSLSVIIPFWGNRGGHSRPEAYATDSHQEHKKTNGLILGQAGKGRGLHLGSVLRDLIKSFGVIIVVTTEGEVNFRPIGGNWPDGICDAIEEVVNAYPGCKIKLFTHNYEPKYWKGIISSDRLLN